MLTKEEIKMFKADGFTFEQIQQISDSYDAVQRGETISGEEFWTKLHSKINSKMKEHV